MECSLMLSYTQITPFTYNFNSNIFYCQLKTTSSSLYLISINLFGCKSYLRNPASLCVDIYKSIKNQEITLFISANGIQNPLRTMVLIPMIYTYYKQRGPMFLFLSPICYMGTGSVHMLLYCHSHIHNHRNSLQPVVDKKNTKTKFDMYVLTLKKTKSQRKCTCITSESERGSEIHSTVSIDHCDVVSTSYRCRISAICNTIV